MNPAPRAFIFHGYQGYPGEAWLPWLRSELERRGYAAELPAMPRPDHPVIAEWVGFIARLVGEPDAGTVLVGHSVGGQAVVRYLEALGAAGKSVARTVLVASGFPPGLSPAEADRRSGGDAVLRPWLTTPVDAEKVRRAAGRCTVILSDNDPYLPLAFARDSYRGKLAAELVVEPGRGHFNEDDRVSELPAALRAALGA